MFNVTRLIIWICRKFNREQIQLIIENLTGVLEDPNSEIQPKDTFKEGHPHYRDFDVDPNPPLKENPKKKRKNTTRCF